MGKISNYDVAAYNGDAIVIGTEPESGDTKNYRLGDIPGTGGGGGGFVSGKRGRFFSSVVQSVIAINTPQFVTFNNSDTAINDGVIIANNINNAPGRITVLQDGVYNFSFMMNWKNLGNQHQDCSFYLKKNGTDINNSIYFNSTQEASMPILLTYMLELAANDYIELVWSPSTINQQLYGEPVYAAPTVSSVTATINQI